jgi:dihydrofolate reductase
MVIGGGEVYRAAMPVADRLYISHVDLSPEGDTSFPEIRLEAWEPVERVPVAPDPRDSAGFSVVVYRRRAGAGR